MVLIGLVDIWLTVTSWFILNWFEVVLFGMMTPKIRHVQYCQVVIALYTLKSTCQAGGEKKTNEMS